MKKTVTVLLALMLAVGVIILAYNYLYEKKREKPIVIGLKRSLTEFPEEKWVSSGTKSYQLQVLPVTCTSEEMVFIVRAWFFALSQKTPPPQNLFFVVSYDGNEVKYSPEIYRRRMYYYTEAVLFTIPVSGKVVVTLVSEKTLAEITLTHEHFSILELSYIVIQHTNLKEGLYVRGSPKPLTEIKDISELSTKISEKDHVYLIISRGFLSTGGYTLVIDNIKRKGDIFYLKVIYVNPPPGAVVIQVITSPAAIVDLGILGKGEYSVVVDVYVRVNATSEVFLKHMETSFKIPTES